MAAAISDLPLPVTLCGTASSAAELACLENVDVAVEIATLSSVRAEIIISGLAAAILDLQLPVTLCGIVNGAVELADLENMVVVVEISTLSSPQAEI